MASEAARLIVDDPPDVEGGEATRGSQARGSRASQSRRSQGSQDNIPGLNPAQIKKDFIIKVYAILSAQILLTTALVSVCVYVPAVGSVAEGLFFRWNPTFMTFICSLLYYIPVVITLCALMMKGDDYPTNFVLLVLFTLLIAFPIGGACYQMVSTGQGPAVLYALGLTALIFISISIFVSCRKFEDSSMFFLYTFVYCLLCVNIFLGFFALVLGWSLGMWMYNVLGVIIFCGYILFDTWLILQKTDIQHVDTRMAIFGAVKLYLDIINLFLHILSLMRRR